MWAYGCVTFSWKIMIKFASIIAMSIASVTYAEYYDTKRFEWVGGNFDWPCETTKNMYKSSGRYISKNVIATRAVIYKDEAIVTLPRFKSGVPATLAKLPLKNRLGIQPLLKPFPSWSYQEEDDCDALQSAVDVFLDPHTILWVLDTGVVRSLEDPIRTCPPKVVAINLKTGKVVKTILLDEMATPSSRLQYVTADYSGDGRVFVYVTDAASRAILVYDVTSDRSYRMILPKIVTAGAATPDVLYSVLLRRSDGSACLVFTYLGGDRIFSLLTNKLRNGTSVGNVNDLGSKPKKMVFLGTDGGSVMYFRYEGDSAVYRWDTNHSFDLENFEKVYSGHECSLTTQVTADGKRARVRIMESNFPDFFQGTVGVGVEHALIII
ncbi:protein yellow-like [Venturia canescens]|uniref:protein yellow-like n=1 Tax=Venturia canescens TaxID=32260 RepID=UPI001C9C5FC8|nr:protein yellow-like [Venturia canescens]